MTTRTTCLGLLLLGLLFAPSATYAQGSGAPPARSTGGAGARGPGEQGPPRPPIDTALDRDGDETIGAAEIAAAATSLRALDKNGDGRLTQDECLPARPGEPAAQDRGTPSGSTGSPGGARPLPPILSALDGDGDGVLSAAEIAGAPTALKSLDKDGNGALSPEEYRPPRPGAPGREPQGGEGPGGPEDSTGRPGGGSRGN